MKLQSEAFNLATILDFQSVGSYVLMMKDESAKMFWNIKKQIIKLEFELHMTTYLTQKCWEVLGKD